MAYSASRIDGQAIGWLPRQAYDQAHQQNRMISCTNNDDLVGFAVFGCSHSDLRIYQIWVRRDARMLIHGRSIIDHLNDKAWPTNLTRLGLWCAIDLAANLFWKALGFINTNWRWGKAKKARKHLQWTKPIQDPRLRLPDVTSVCSTETAADNCDSIAGFTRSLNVSTDSPGDGPGSPYRMATHASTSQILVGVT